MHTVLKGAGGSLPRLFVFWVAAMALTPAVSARADYVGSPVARRTVLASWYGQEFKGHRTASGERYDPTGLTCAHRTLPLGTKVRVTNPRTGASVLVTVTDRGPFRQRRELDLSRAAAREVGLLGPGVARLVMEVL
jgi:peptidoglycan lytic transglycosylase